MYRFFQVSLVHLQTFHQTYRTAVNEKPVRSLSFVLFLDHIPPWSPASACPSLYWCLSGLGAELLFLVPLFSARLWIPYTLSPRACMLPYSWFTPLICKSTSSVVVTECPRCHFLILGVSENFFILSTLFSLFSLYCSNWANYTDLSSASLILRQMRWLLPV